MSFEKSIFQQRRLEKYTKIKPNQTKKNTKGRKRNKITEQQKYPSKTLTFVLFIIWFLLLFIYKYFNIFFLILVDVVFVEPFLLLCTVKAGKLLFCFCF